MNEDVVKVNLSAEEKAAVKSEPVAEVIKEEPKLGAEEEVKEVKEAEAKEPQEVKEDKKEEKPKAAEETEKTKKITFSDVFKPAVKEKEKEVAEMTVDERAEYEALKKEKIIKEHQNAYEKMLLTYPDDEREIIKKRLDKILKQADDPDTDIFGKLSKDFSPAQVAYITTAMSELEERERLEEIRSKRMNTAVKDAVEKAVKSAEVKKTLTEIADISTVGDTSEMSAAEKHKRLIEKGFSADRRTRDQILAQALKEKLRK